MLKSVTKTAKTLLKTPSTGFCAYVRYLDPAKHITMNHNFQNVYEDTVKLGMYPLPQKEMVKELSKKYVPEIMNTVYSVLNSKQSAVKLDPKKYEEQSEKTWEELGVNIEEHIGEIMLRLSKELFITEHKLRYTVEQRRRHQITTELYTGAYLNRNEVSEFFDSYNSFLWRDIERSNLFREPKIKGVKSFAEKDVEDGTLPPFGIAQLKRDIPENHTLINAIMNALHS